VQSSVLKPLAGKRIVVTRPKQQARALSEKLQELGAATVEIPSIEIMPPIGTDQLDAALRQLERYDWVVFTSVHGVEAVHSRLSALELPLSFPPKPMIAAIGPATATALRRAGRSPDYVPEEFLSEKIVHGLGEMRGKLVLLPRADIASKKLPILLRERGAVVDEISVYRTVVPSDLTSESVHALFQSGVNLVTFTSPSTVRSLARVVGTDQLRNLLKGVKVACIGPVTLEAAKELGIDVEVVAMTHTIDALVEAIVNEIGTVRET